MTLRRNKLIAAITIPAVIVLILTSTIATVRAENNFNVQITNLAGEAYNLADQQLFDMPKTVVNADLYCEGSLLTSGNWTGIRLSYLLNEANTPTEVNSIQFTASDGYKVTIPYDLAIQPQTIIAYQKDSEPITEQLRLILPGYNGAAWIAKITTITMSTTGASYPEGITVGGGSLPKLLSTPTPMVTEQTPVTPQPQPNVPTNSPNIEVESPTNAPVINQPTIPSQVSKNVEGTVETSFIIVIFISILIFSITTVKVYKSKKSSNSPENRVVEEMPRTLP